MDGMSALRHHTDNAPQMLPIATVSVWSRFSLMKSEKRCGKVLLMGTTVFSIYWHYIHINIVKVSLHFT